MNSAIPLDIQFSISEAYKLLSRTEELVHENVIYRKLAEKMKTVVCKTDCEGRLLFVDRDWKEVTGFTVRESLGKGLSDFFLPDDLEKFSKQFSSLMQGLKDHCHLEVRSLTNEGGLRWLECFVMHTFNDSGKLKGAKVTLKDITARKQVESLNRDFMLAQEAALDGIALVNDKGEYVHLNRSHVEMFGFTSASELIGKTWREIYKDDEIARIESEVFPVLMANGVWSGMATAKRRDGSTFPEELSLSLLPNGGIVCICRDVTEKMKAAEALRDSEARWQLAVESITDGIWDADLKTGVVHLSPSCKGLLGMIGRELTTSLQELTARMHPEDISMLTDAAKLQSVMEIGRYDEEHRIKANDGSYRWLHIKGRTLFDAKGNPMRMLGTVSDISERKQIHDQLLTNLAREKELSELRSNFVSMASHELRTPLATLSLALEFLTAYRPELSEEAIEKSLTTANHSALHLSAIVDDLLLLGCADQGQLKCTTETISVWDHLSMMSSEAKLPGSHRHRINITCEPPDFEANLDPQLLQHMLVNLLSNACKYSADPLPVQLRARQLAEAIELQVEDSGIGISEVDQNRIFTLFFRGRNVGAIPGTGLGLMVVKQCVEAHGGNITFTSSINKGTCFTITIPTKH
jgi:PAS domain S-box-containing protein